MKTKQKLLASVAMLLVSAVMMTSVSFAWFTISTNPEITGISVGVTTNDNLEIAVNTYTASGWSTTVPDNNTSTDSSISQTGDYTTWGNLVDLTDEFAANSTLELKPAYYDTSGNPSANELMYPTYESDGRIDALEDLAVKASTSVSNATVGTKEVDDKVNFAIYTSGDGDETYGFATQYFLRTNQTGIISLSDAVSRMYGTASDSTSSMLDGDAMGSGSYISGVPESLADNIVIAFTISSYDSTNTTLTEVGTVYGVLDTSNKTTDVVSAGAEATYTYDLTTVATISGEITGGNIVTGGVAGDLFQATANTVYVVTMTVYLDGNTITNADATDIEATSSIGINVQFSNAGLTDTLAMTPGEESDS